MGILDQQAARFGQFLSDHPGLVVITGAGISAASGIPTYRDGDGKWLHSEPIKHQEFLGEPLKRKRYWARSMRGWPAVRDAQPNRAHAALALLEAAGHVRGIITQNVDRLHQRAGSERVWDLHGRLDRVRCLDCETSFSRELVQGELLRLNPPRIHQPVTPARPDGDADLPDSLAGNVRVPGCPTCNGILMPDVVFFGGTVPRERVDACMRAVDEADALLAVGTSLQVFSGYRFCRRAAETGKPIAIINPGVTRADSMAEVKLEEDCGELLDALAHRLNLPSALGSPN